MNIKTKNFKTVILALLLCLLCVCLLGCSGRYYQYTGASMNTANGLATTLRQEAEEGETFILQTPASTLRVEKDGSATKFVGWQVKGGDSTVYPVGQSMTMGKKNMTLQAVWQNAYKITFVNNDSSATGTLPTLAQEYFAVGETIEMPTCSLTKENYGFGGWKAPDGKIYQANSTFTMPDSAVEFIPTWTNVYTLTFLSGADNEQQVTGSAPTLAPREMGSTVYLPKCTFSYAGYDFVCWQSEGVDYNVGDLYQVKGHATFVAKWQKSATTSTETFDFTLLADNTYAVAKSSTLTTTLTGNLVLPATFNDLPVTVVKANGFKNASIDSVTIPASITTIEANAFANTTKLFSVVFEANSQLTTIGENAFLQCSKLATLGVENTAKNTAVLPDGVTTIGNKAFYGCAFKKFTINSQLQNLGNGVFANQKYLEEFTSNSANFVGTTQLTDPEGNFLYAFAPASQNGTTVTVNTDTILPYTFSFANVVTVNLGEKVKIIAEYAFENCHSLTTINYDQQNALTTIKDGAFLACSALTTVYIGKDVTQLALSAFEGCMQVSKFEVHEDNTLYCSYVDNLYNKDKTVFLLCAPNMQSPNCFLPNTVIKIGANAFAYSKVQEVFIYNTDENHEIAIEDKAFYHCSFLKVVSFWNKISSIGARAFEYCTVMDNAVLGDKLQYMGEYAFYYCEKLSTITISDNCQLTTIAPSAFANCALTEFDSKGKIQTIERNAFASCANITKIKINGVLEIEFGAFASCKNLKTVEIPSSLVTLAGGAFKEAYGAMTFTVAEDNALFSADANGSLYNKDKTTLVLCAPKEATGAYTLPATVKTIAPYAFYAMELTSLDATNSALETIGEYAFANCSLLVSVKAPTSLKYIKAYAFDRCLMLADFDFFNQGNKANQNLAKIEEYAFKNCIRLKIYLLGDQLPVVDENAFYLEPEAAASSNNPRVFVSAEMLEEAKVRWPFIEKYLQANA